RRGGGRVESEERFAPRSAERRRRDRAVWPGEATAPEPRAGSSTAAPAGEPSAAGAPLPQVRLQLLGGFRVWIGGPEVAPGAWPRRKPAQLLKLLALAPGHRLPREQVLERLWPDLEPDAAANNLHTAIYFVRRVLAPEGGAAAGAYLRLRSQQL